MPDDAFWNGQKLRLAVARALHRQCFNSDDAAERHWIKRPQDRGGWFRRAMPIIAAVRRETERYRPTQASR